MVPPPAPGRSARPRYTDGMLTFYGYPKCSTCRKAAKWLDDHGVAYGSIDITAQPPPAALLRCILQQGDYQLKDLFNRSGEVYRQMNLKGRLPGMTDGEAIDLLAAHGKLVKRPIATDDRRFTVGFDPDRYEQVWG